MTMHVIIGAGPVGSATAARLAGQGEKVRVLTRSGAGPHAAGVKNIAVDATDTELRPWLIRAGGLIVPYLREFGEVAYQFTGPFVVDSAAFQATFNAAPIPVDEALDATLTWWRDQGRDAALEGSDSR